METKQLPGLSRLLAMAAVLAALASCDGGGWGFPMPSPPGFVSPPLKYPLVKTKT